jgi:glucosamine-6-phosphate deaminase
MEVIATSDYDELSRRAAELVRDRLAGQTAPLVALATGNTPLGLYRELVASRQADDIDYDGLRVAQLDEYAGITKGDPRSLLAWLDRVFLGPAGVAMGRVTSFDPEAPDTAAEAARVDGIIAAIGPISLQVLGLGPNGHIGFNEPGSGADTPTRAVTLTEASLASNAAYWDGAAVPPRAYTIGMTRLLAAENTLLLASGEEKAAILARVLEGPATPEVPASLLAGQPGVTVIADEAALSLCAR